MVAAAAVAAAHPTSEIARYLAAQPADIFDEIYRRPASCLAIFRLLSPLAKQIVMRLMSMSCAVSVGDFRIWCSVAAHRDLDYAIQQCSKLCLLKEISGTNMFALNETFGKKLYNVLCGRSTENSFGLTVKSHGALTTEAVSIRFLDEYAKATWENVLQFMVGESKIKPDPAVVRLLKKLKLISREDGDFKRDYEITKKGFQFLLQDVNAQIAAFLFKYLKLAGSLDMSEVSVLNFMLYISSLELGVGYSSEHFDDVENTLLQDMLVFGILYRKTEAKEFYPTRLATTLTSGKAAITSGQNESNGFIILETNFRIYAYTSSELQLSILGLFCDIGTRFPGFILGMITQATMERAFRRGITANQIIRFLKTNAHPLMKKSSLTSVLPLTIVDQMRLWELDLQRIQLRKGRLLCAFANQEEFDDICAFLRGVDGILWSDIRSMRLVLKDDKYKDLKAHVKRVHDVRESSHELKRRKTGDN